MDIVKYTVLGPGEEQADWVRYINRTHKAPHKWGSLEYSDPGNRVYDAMFRIVFADYPFWMATLKQSLVQSTYRNLGIVKTGDIWEAILACYLFSLDVGHLHLSRQEQMRHAYWIPIVQSIASTAVHIEYGKVLHEVYVLLRYLMYRLGLNEHTLHLLVGVV